MKSTILLAVLASMAAPSIAYSYSMEMKIFGHDLAINEPGFDEFERSLSIDGRVLHKNGYINIQEILLVGTTPVVVVSTSTGGNACEASPIVISFPRGGSPRMDGPLDTCYYDVTAEQGADGLSFSTPPTPSQMGQKWMWTLDGGFREVEGTSFSADPEKGWAELRERTVSHPSDLYDYQPIGAEINRLAGKDRQLVSNILVGVGSAEFDQDYLVGSACSRHMCGDQEALVVADIPNKIVYLAWKPSGEKIKVNPKIFNWPDSAKVYIRSWAEKWR